MLIIVLLLFQTAASETVTQSSNYTTIQSSSLDAIRENNANSTLMCFRNREKRNNSTRQELDCCFVYKYFTRVWHLRKVFLTEFLEILKYWNCPQFEEECENPTFDFSEFTRLVYSRACNYENFIKECYPIVEEFFDGHSEKTAITEIAARKQELPKSLSSYHNATYTTINSMWRELTNSLTFGETTLPLPPCVQVALYDKSDRVGSYFEVLRKPMPFCPLSWCGLDESSVRKNYVSVWSCMDFRCHSGISFALSLVGLLSLTIACSNGIVVVVFLRNKYLRHSQGIYKMSLSIADFIIGSVVLPSFAVSILEIVFARQTLNKTYPPNVSQLLPPATMRYSRILGYSEQVFANTTSNITNLTTIDARLVFTITYHNVVGFFTTLSFIASLYSLMIASIDRLSLVRNPLKYNARKAKRQAIWASVSLWITSIVISSLPLVFPGDFRYGLIASVLISITGEKSLYVYLLAIIVPVLVMWIATIISYKYAYKHARQRSAQDFFAEDQLTRTIILMVGIFTLSLLPAFASVVVSLTYSPLFYKSPATLDIDSEVYFVSYEFIAIIIVVCNSSWNFFIYNARNKSFRKETKRLFTDIREKLKQPNVSQTSVTNSTI